MPSLEQAHRQGLGLAAGRSIEQLRRVSGVELVLTGHFGPIVDGRLLERDSQEVFLAGAQAPVPLLVGANTDEGANYTRPGVAVPAGYPAGPPRLFVGESRFNYPVWRWAVTHVATSGAPTWLYRFEHEPPLPEGIDLAPPPDGLPGYGVYHTAELPYTGDNLAMLDWPWTDTDRDLATAMAGAWASFVTRLDPGEQWPAFDGTDDGAVRVFGKGPGAGVGQVGRASRLEAMHLLDGLPRPL
jgi:para-nitrobenzyl esterase